MFTMVGRSLEWPKRQVGRKKHLPLGLQIAQSRFCLYTCIYIYIYVYIRIYVHILRHEVISTCMLRAPGRWSALGERKGFGVLIIDGCPFGFPQLQYHLGPNNALGIQIAQSRHCLYTLGPKVGITYILGSPEIDNMPARNLQKNNPKGS